MEIATLAGGCFWCTEAVFQQLRGVSEVFSGFTGGTVKNPAYREVVTGKTGHAEAVVIHFDPQIISYETLLAVFFATHDPTTLNRQGADQGTHYRSAIFYHSATQKEIAEAHIAALSEAGVFENPIVTTLSPFDSFYKAEPEHHNYYSLHPEQGYCQFVIYPKLLKLQEKFKDMLK